MWPLAVLTFFFYGNVWPFCRDEKTGCKNEVAVRRGSIVVENIVVLIFNAVKLFV